MGLDTSLIHGFFRSAQRFPERPALEAGGEIYSYSALAGHAASIAEAIVDSGDDRPLVALLAERSLAAYAGILGILSAARGYVPLNPSFPVERSVSMIEQSGVGLVVVGPECVQHLAELLSSGAHDFVLLCVRFDKAELDQLRGAFPDHRFIACALGGARRDVAVPSVAPDSLAYVMFTSGSTGAPKGVPISNRNAISYVRYIASTQDISEQDRFAQAVDLTFDLCIHPIFVCWEVGACLCSLPRESVMAPALFIRRERITVWVSVPSTGVFLLTMRLLKPGTFPHLRLSVFCGEPLSAKVAAAWQAACPNGRVENVYGPTEATVAITRYVWDEERSETECENGIVPIGWLFEGQMGLIVGDKLHPVEQGTPGELLLAGSQVTSGYLNQPALNADRFVHVPGSTERWYRTGDLVREDGNRCLHYVGRIDNQVKVRGFRVELQEIDHALRRAAGTEDAIALAWPIRNGSADGIIAFVAGQSVETSRIMAECRASLPAYMVPSAIHLIDRLPLNSNGKIDRKALAQRLAGEDA